MSWDEINSAAQELAEQALEGATEVSTSSLGLDRRAASSLFLGPDYLAVPANQDRALRYYGGFEYVDEEYRMELGGWVFYSTENERVQGHWSHYEG